jgi:N-acetylglutamate synthase/N-acetylornithine aminotransferase
VKMPLTRDYNETVVTRIQRDRKFARAFYAETMSALLDGETAEPKNGSWTAQKWTCRLSYNYLQIRKFQSKR